MRLIAILSLFVAASCPAATFYVNNAGDDSADGRSHATAWASLARVNGASFGAGDIVLFREGGRWEGRLYVDWAGTSSAHAVVGAYYLDDGREVRGLRGQRPIIDGAGHYPTGGIYDALVVVNTRDRVRLENLRIINSEGRGIAYRRSNFGEVIGIEVEDVYMDGIHFLDSDYATVERSTVTHAALVFPRDGRLHPWGAAITLVNSDSAQVRESRVIESYGEGINAHSGSAGTVIEKNVIFGARAVGIYSDASPNTTIRRNLVVGTANSSLWRSGELVGAGIAINNERYHYEGYGGSMSPAVQSKNAKIYGNLVAYTSSGIALWSALPDTSHDNLVVFNNTLVDNGTQIAGLSAQAPGGRLVNNVLLSLSTGAKDVDATNLSGMTARNNYFSQGDPGGDLSHVDNAYSGVTLGRMTGWRSFYAVNDIAWNDFAPAAGSSTIAGGDDEPLQMAGGIHDFDRDFNELIFASPMELGALKFSSAGSKVPRPPWGLYTSP